MKKSLLMIASLGLLFSFVACDRLIYDDEGDCSVKVRFRYDYNMKYADAFATEVSSVTLYLIDGSGSVVLSRTESGATLAEEGYCMTLEPDVVPTGTYDFLVWGGTTDKGSFSIPSATVGTGLTCTLERSHDSSGAAYVDTDLDRLFHGYLENVSLTWEEEGTVLTVPLVKNTNNVRVVLQQISGQAFDEDTFTVSITDDNGLMDWDNSLLSDETITYYNWYKSAVSAGMESKASVSYSGLATELTVPRLVDRTGGPRLRVTNNDLSESNAAAGLVEGDQGYEDPVILDLPLIDLCLLVKGYYNQGMDDQEYLDRQDEWDMIFFLDDGWRWFDAYIYVNSWKVVFQSSEL